MRLFVVGRKTTHKSAERKRGAVRLSLPLTINLGFPVQIKKTYSEPPIKNAFVCDVPHKRSNSLCFEVRNICTQKTEMNQADGNGRLKLVQSYEPAFLND